jgi:hypothetical protein
MFKESNIVTQIDMFNDVSHLLSSRKRKLLENPIAWHNIFYINFVSKINEDIFSVLFNKAMGRPNAPIRILIGMMVLKEGNGWSDKQLFEECRFNTMMMRSLGLININDDVPTESTYYEFRKTLSQYNDDHKKDLIKTCFTDVISKQVVKHGVRGEKIRLDSKLINSNISKSTRLELIVEAVRKYVQTILLVTIKDAFESKEYELLEKLQGQSTSNFTYPLNGKEKKEMLITMGWIMQKLLNVYEVRGEDYSIMSRIYKEQYTEQENKEEEQTKVSDQNNDDKNISSNNKVILEEEKDEELQSEKTVTPKEPKEIASGSVQSVHDPEAAYRSKGEGTSKQVVSGYHANITETCDPTDDLNLITDVETVPANITEDKFLVESVQTTQEVLTNTKGEEKKIKEVITDGGYDSKSNREKMLETDQPTWKLTKMKGARHVYKMKYNEQGQLEVYDIKTNEKLDVSYSQRANKYVVKQEGGNRRYFTKEEIDNYIRHQLLDNQIDTESYNLRANVESTVHQTFHRVKKRNKIVYRGLIKCQWYVISRAFWVNIMRITDKEIKNVYNLILFSFLVLETTMISRVQNTKYRNRNKRNNEFCINIHF